MSQQATDWKARWQVKLVCRDCSSSYEYEDPDTGVDKLPGHSRFVLLRAPETCPECKNIKLAPEPAERAQSETAEVPDPSRSA
jgi:rubredoxin